MNQDTNVSKETLVNKTIEKGNQAGNSPWASLFANSLASQGMQLSYIPPGVREGVPVANLKA